MVRPPLSFTNTMSPKLRAIKKRLPDAIKDLNAATPARFWPSHSRLCRWTRAHSSAAGASRTHQGAARSSSTAAGKLTTPDMSTIV